jgi:hypothetical protein
MLEHGGPALGPNPKLHRQQSMRIAKVALDYYNKKKKVSFIVYSRFAATLSLLGRQV